jgi:hypothetical protein
MRQAAGAEVCFSALLARYRRGIGYSAMQSKNALYGLEVLRI